MDLEAVITRLKSQVSQGEAVLFLGAGFSRAAFDVDGRPLPTGAEFAEECWRLAFTDLPFEATTRLADAFEAAKMRTRRRLSELVKRRLSVDADRLRDEYATWFKVPWIRCYTLNLDDLEVAVSRRFASERGLYSVSATSERSQGTRTPNSLEVVHLNGAVWDELDEMTFSDLDYGARQSVPDSWYSKCSNDIVGRPVVFVGTDLNEPTLWQYLEFRRRRGSARSTREFRPHSYLVCPTLNPAKEVVLKELNIEWLPMGAEEFATAVLDSLGPAIAEGQGVLRQKADSDARSALLQLVVDLANRERGTQSEYLLGEEPRWSDLAEGKAILRDCDEEIYATSKSVLAATGHPSPLLISGTAGSGKSTSLKRLGLRLSAEGIATYWLDESSNVEAHQLNKIVAGTSGELAILIDDADRFGRLVTGWARELPKMREGVLVACALRSSRIDGVLDRESLGGTEPYEVSMPPLQDGEIEDLIAVLDKYNRLGVLKGKSQCRQSRRIQEAGRATTASRDDPGYFRPRLPEEGHR